MPNVSELKQELSEGFKAGQPPFLNWAVPLYNIDTARKIGKNLLISMPEAYCALFTKLAALRWAELDSMDGYYPGFEQIEFPFMRFSFASHNAGLAAAPVCSAQPMPASAIINDAFQSIAMTADKLRVNFCNIATFYAEGSLERIFRHRVNWPSALKDWLIEARRQFVSYCEKALNCDDQVKYRFSSSPGIGAMKCHVTIPAGLQGLRYLENLGFDREMTKKFHEHIETRRSEALLNSFRKGMWDNLPELLEGGKKLEELYDEYCIHTWKTKTLKKYYEEAEAIFHKAPPALCQEILESAYADKQIFKNLVITFYARSITQDLLVVGCMASIEEEYPGLKHSYSPVIIHTTARTIAPAEDIKVWLESVFRRVFLGSNAFAK